MLRRAAPGGFTMLELILFSAAAILALSGVIILIAALIKSILYRFNPLNRWPDCDHNWEYSKYFYGTVSHSYWPGESRSYQGDHPKLRTCLKCGRRQKLKSLNLECSDEAWEKTDETQIYTWDEIETPRRLNERMALKNTAPQETSS